MAAGFCSCRSTAPIEPLRGGGAEESRQVLQQVHQFGFAARNMGTAS